VWFQRIFGGFLTKDVFFFCGEIERWGKGMVHEEGWLLGVVVKQVANISGFEHI
jgi:hypothetical protein